MRRATLRTVPGALVDAGFLSVPESVWFPTDGERPRAQLFYYAPRNRDCTPMPGERPPLVVISHGGPIAAADSTLDYGVQFWTSRGFAVADVNYGGSTGFGRDYRQRLERAVGHRGRGGLHPRHRVPGGARARPIRRGSSSAAAAPAASPRWPRSPAIPRCSRPAPATSASAISKRSLHDSHKFEARCLDILVGPYPAEKALYEERSPIHHVDRLQCPLILLQGLEDKVVPPNQSEMMADALRRKGRPVAYITFAGEQHGFRKAENIIRSLEAELYFYGAVFGFAPADRIEPVAIDNLPAQT